LFVKNDLTNQQKQLDTLSSLASSESSSDSINAKTHSKNVIDSLHKKLAQYTTQFKDILEIRTQTLKDQQKSRMVYTGSSSLSESNFPQLEPDMNEVTIQMPEDMVMVPTNVSATRSEAVKRIESTIVEIEGIFHQLRGLVIEQGELMQRIDEDIEDTAQNLDNSQNQLLKYWSSLSSSRSLTVKIFAVLIVFVIAFVVFFV